MSLRVFTYSAIEDAWNAAVPEWCRSANDRVLAGGEAWLLTANAGQQQWIKARCLRAGVPLVGVRLPDASQLRRLLCARFGVEPPAFGSDSHDFLLSLWAQAVVGQPGTAAAADAENIGRHPAGWRAALEHLDAAGWLDESRAADESGIVARNALPPLLLEWLPALRATGSWVPAIDRKLCARAAASAGSAAKAGVKPLSVLAIGWDALCWARRDLFVAALRAAAPVSAEVLLPAPRGIGHAEAVAQDWIEAIAAGHGAEEEIRVCPSSAQRPPRHATLVERLESVDLGSPDEAEAADSRPAMLVGSDWTDQIALAEEWIARWLLETADDAAARLCVLFPTRGPLSAAFLRAASRAGLAVEDNLGERPEAPLPVQIARAILDYHLDETGIEPLLTLVGLLNDCPACWIRDPHDFGLPLEPVALRRALADAFIELQHRSARLLADGSGFARSTQAGPLGRLIKFLDRWPESLPWAEARARWEDCLRAFKLEAAELLPTWSRLAALLPDAEPVPVRAFFEYVRNLLGGIGALPRPAAEHRPFARVFVTTLSGAVGQTWQAALFMDSNEGVWPQPHTENPCLDDRLRSTLNARRDGANAPRPGHLLTSADRSSQEQANFYEILESCTGPVAFASVRRAPDDATHDAHPNEWSLRCWVESASAAERRADHWLERWRRAAVRIERPAPALPRREAKHLGGVFGRRRDSAVPFDEYQFDFSALAAETDEGALERSAAWAARQLDAAWHGSATFSLEAIFGVQAWRDGAAALARAENAAVGRLTHRWINEALGGGAKPRPLSFETLQAALGAGLARARADDELALRRSLAGTAIRGSADGLAVMPPWWRGVFAKTAWAARGCLETLARRVEEAPAAAAWYCVRPAFSGIARTPAGPLRLYAKPDLLLLDRETIRGATCCVVDFQTGSGGASPRPLKPAQLGEGKGLVQAAELFLALENGIDRESASAAIVHPEGVCWSSLTAIVIDAPEAQSALRDLARLQNELRFGQRPAVKPPPGRRARGPSGENLPLACTPVDAASLKAKARLGRVDD